MKWDKKVEWRLYGVKNGPYIIELLGTRFNAWLLGHKFIGSFDSLSEAQHACETDVCGMDTTD
jgi:hypothetical protein